MYVSVIRKYCDWQLLLFESAWSVSEILHCSTSRIWGNNQFRIEEKRARNEHEDFQTFRKVFESSALHEVSFFVTEQMHPFTPKHVYAPGHLLPRGAQHWTHSCPAIALAWSNVHNSNLAPRRMSRHFQLLAFNWHGPPIGAKVCFWALGCLSEQEREAGGLKSP